MENKFLTIGSVVLLKDAEKRLMITGRLVTREDDNQIYDYTGCLFPEGITSSTEMYFFNNENIGKIYFVGLQDEEEFAYQEYLENLGELEVVDGQIVTKQ